MSENNGRELFFVLVILFTIPRIDQNSGLYKLVVVILFP